MANLLVPALPVFPAPTYARLREHCQTILNTGDDKAGASQTETRFVLKSSSNQVSNIQLNDKFAYSIILANDVLTVTVIHNDLRYTASEPISAFWKDSSKTLYFKAGAYLQVGKPGSAAGTIGSGEGAVSFYYLPRPTHP